MFNRHSQMHGFWHTLHLAVCARRCFSEGLVSVSVSLFALPAERRCLPPSLCRVPLIRMFICLFSHSFMELSLSPSPVPVPALNKR